jgi:hypothetical protein
MAGLTISSGQADSELNHRIISARKGVRSAHSSSNQSFGMTGQPSLQAQQQQNGFSNGSSIFGNGQQQQQPNGMSLFGGQAGAASGFNFNAVDSAGYNNPFASTSGSTSQPSGPTGFSGSIFNFTAPVQPQAQDNAMSDENDENYQPGGDKKRSRPSLEGPARANFSFGGMTQNQQPQPATLQDVTPLSEQLQPATTSLFNFGAPAQTSNSNSLFAPSTPAVSIFSLAPTAASTIFGGQSSNPFNFGNPAGQNGDVQSQSHTTLQAQAQSGVSTSLFGQAPQNTIASSLISSTPSVSQPNLFQFPGNGSEHAQSNIFSNVSQPAAASLFAPTASSRTAPSIFSQPPGSSQGSTTLFSQPQQSDALSTLPSAPSSIPRTQPPDQVQHSQSLFAQSQPDSITSAEQPAVTKSSLFSFTPTPASASAPSQAAPTSATQPAPPKSSGSLFGEKPAPPLSSLFTSSLLTPVASEATAKPASPSRQATEPTGADLPALTGKQVNRMLPEIIPTHFTEEQKVRYIAAWRLKLIHVGKNSALQKRPTEAMYIVQYSNMLEEQVFTEMYHMLRMEPDGEGGFRKKVDEPRISRARKPIFGGDDSNKSTGTFGFSNAQSSKRKPDNDLRDEDNEDEDESNINSTKKVRGEKNESRANGSNTSKLFASIAAATTTTPAGSPTKQSLFTQPNSGSPAMSPSIFSSGNVNTTSPAKASIFTPAATTASSSSSLFASGNNNQDTATKKSIFAPSTSASTTAQPSLFSPAKSANSASGTTFDFSKAAQTNAGTKAIVSTPLFGSQVPSTSSSIFPQSSKSGSDAAPKSSLFPPQIGATSGSDSESGRSAVSAVPSFGPVSGTNFFAQFGQAAKKAEDEEKKKRKLEDFDSEDETEEEWEKRDAEEQAKKKAMIAELAKSTGGFKFQPSPALSAQSSESVFSNLKPAGSGLSTPNMFGSLSNANSDAEGSKTGDADNEEEESDDEESPAVVSTGRSLFDRIEMDENGQPKRDTSESDKEKPTSIFSSGAATPKAASTSDLFSSSISGNNTTSLFGTKPATTNPGDHTWKPDTPIKFAPNTSAGTIGTTGTTAPPLFSFTSPSPTKPTAVAQTHSLGSLFGTPQAASPAPSTPTNIFGGLSSTGFNFGGPVKNATLGAPVFASTSNSRATSPGFTTGDESNAGDEEPAAADEQIDLIASRAGEEDEDCIMEVKAKGSELAENSEGEKAWIVRATGPLRVLKNRDTGKTRIVLRIEGSARIGLNAALMAGMEYKLGGTGNAEGKVLIFGVATGAGKIARWTLRVGKKEDAEKLRDLLEENKKN